MLGRARKQDYSGLTTAVLPCYTVLFQKVGPSAVVMLFKPLPLRLASDMGTYSSPDYSSPAPTNAPGQTVGSVPVIGPLPYVGDMKQVWAPGFHLAQLLPIWPWRVNQQMEDSLPLLLYCTLQINKYIKTKI